MPTFSHTGKKSWSRKRAHKRKSFGRKKPWSSRAKKRPYRPKNKQTFINRSNPVSENKQVEGSSLSATIGNNPDGNPVLANLTSPPPIVPDASGWAMDTQHYHFIPDSACYQTHGLDETQMSGRSVYQRLCAAKFLIKWPQSTMNTGINMEEDPAKPIRYLMGQIPSQPQSYKLYWGFVPMKHMLTGYTTPYAAEASAFYLETQVKQRIQNYFDTRGDRIAFIPKRTSTIQIIGSKTLRAPNYNLGRMATTDRLAQSPDDDADGNIADTLVKVTWPLNRKIHFEPSNKFGWDPTLNAGAGGPVAPSSGATVFYKNYDFIPFAVIVSWNHDKLPENDATIVDPETDSEYEQKYARTMRVPHLLVNDITYYRDS